MIIITVPSRTSPAIEDKLIASALLGVASVNTFTFVSHRAPINDFVHSHFPLYWLQIALTQPRLQVEAQLRPYVPFGQLASHVFPKCPAVHPSEQSPLFLLQILFTQLIEHLFWQRRPNHDIAHVSAIHVPFSEKHISS